MKKGTLILIVLVAALAVTAVAAARTSDVIQGTAGNDNLTGTPAGT